MGLFRKKKNPLENWPEMRIVPKYFLEDLVRHMLVCRFLSDLNQGKNGDLYMPYNWFIKATDTMDEAVKQVMDHLEQYAIPMDDIGKIKLYANKEGQAIEI